MLGLLLQGLAALALAVVLVVIELAVAVAWNVGPGGRPTLEGDSRPLECRAGKLIIQIHGTRSTGEFHPDLAGAVDLDDLPSGFFGENFRQKEFDRLLQHNAEDLTPTSACLVTFSFDDHYLVEQQQWRRGLNAWNRSTSPWNVQPDVLASRLQELMSAYPGYEFDIVAYSAGGIVPTYWAARTGTIPQDLARVKTIVVVDGIVWGVDLSVFDWACMLPGLPQAEWSGFGRLPCQFRVASQFTRAVRDNEEWTSPIGLVTLRARGDLIVWHRFAGLPGRTRANGDPTMVVDPCPPEGWGSDFGGCVLGTHGYVLGEKIAIDKLAEFVGSTP